MTETRTRRRSPVWAMLLLVALAVTMAGIFPFRQILSQDRAVSFTEDKLHALELENARLDEEVERLQTPIEIERIARERFGLVRPGEVGFVVDWQEPPEPPPEPELPPPDERAWYEKAWDFLSGRDFDG
jgi:cell division protein FtsB